MTNNKAVTLTYVLANGDEKSLHLNQASLEAFMKWYQNDSSTNPYDIGGEAGGAKTTLYKDTLLSVRY